MVLIVSLLGLGYWIQNRSPLGSDVLGASWGGEPLTVAIGVDGMPLSFTRDDRRAGMWPDLFAQAPLAGRPWSVLNLSESDAAAAVAAGAADAALLPVVRGQTAFGLATSAPLASHSGSLFAMVPILGFEAIAGQSVAWSGAEGLVPVLLRLSSEPVATMSVDDCLTRVLTGTVSACALDEAVGRAHVAALGLDERFLIVGNPLGTIDYVMAWRPTDRTAAQVLPQWLEEAKKGGVLPSLERQWLGMSLARAGAPAWSGANTGLTLALGAMLLAVVGMGIQNGRLRATNTRRVRSLAASVPRHAATFRATRDAVFVLEPRDLTILEANPRAYELTGYEPGRLAGIQFTDLLPARQRRLLRRTFLDEEPVDLDDLPLVHMEGTVATVALHSVVVATATGTERICLATDVTENLGNRREVQRLADLSGRLIQAVPAPLLIVDAAGRVLAANPAGAGIGLGEAALGREVDELLGAEPEPLSRAISSLLARRDGSSLSVTLLAGADKEPRSRALLAPLGEDKNPWGALLLLGPAREEQQSPGNEQRLDVLSALGQVSGVLAHDIRSRVNVASLAIQLFEEGLPADHPDRGSVRFIREEIDFTMEVVDDILTLLRPGKVQREVCHVDEILERVVMTQAPLGHSSGVEIVASLPAGLPTATGDAIQLSRVLTNLVKNAIEASPSGGIVNVNIDLAPAQSGAGSGEELQIRISDQGPGIPPHIRGRLFEPYASGKSGGTGLGLSIVKKIVDEHRGRIEVDSRVNHGTTFTVYLPVSGE